MKRVKGSGVKENPVRYAITAGCDVDKNFVVIAIYNPSDSFTVTREFEQTLSGAKKAAEYLAENAVEYVILESTANYHILFFETFRDVGLNVEIINPLYVKSLLKVEGKSDKGDAINLAKLAYGFTLKTSNMPDLMQREIRIYTRGLDQLKQARTQITNRIQGTLTAYGCTLYRVTKLNSKSGLALLQGICDALPIEELLEKCWFGSKNSLPGISDTLGNIGNLPDYLRTVLNEQLDKVYLLNSEIEAKEMQCLCLIEKFQLQDIVNLMQTAPAITPMLALRIIGEMGLDFTRRYKSNEAFCKAVGVVPSNVVSGGKVLKKQSTHGNKHLKIHVLNAVKSFCVTTKKVHPLKNFYVALKKKTNFKKAVSAVARKIMTSLYAMLKYNQTYVLPNLNYGE